MSAPLNGADLRFVNRVAGRRFAGVDAPPPVESELDEVLAAAAGERSAFLRAARLTAGLLQRHVFDAAPLQTALLVMHCSLSLDGLQLLAPQGVLAGMIKNLAGGGDPVEVARWLEDRAVPSAGER